MGGSGIIEGRFTQEEAQNLVIRLKFGALPFPLRIVETTPIGR
jgi:preprotein translocase subunit SecD